MLYNIHWMDMKIIIFNDRPDYVGGTMYYARLSAILGMQNISIETITATRITSTIAKLDMLLLKYFQISPLSYIRLLMIKKRCADVVFGSNIFLPFKVRKFFNIKVIAWFPDFQMHDLPEMFTDKQLARRTLFEKRLIFFSDKIVVQNDADLKRMLAKVPGKDVQVLKFFHPKSLKKSNQDITTNQNDYILVAAQGWRHKRIDQVIKCYEASLKKYDLVLIGSTDDPRDKKYSEELNRLIESSSATYLGFVDEQKKERLFSNCRAVLNFSLYEGWNSSIEEAISYAKPTILSDIPVHREQVPEATFVSNNKTLRDVFSGIVKIKDLQNPDEITQRRADTVDNFVREL